MIPTRPATVNLSTIAAIAEARLYLCPQTGEWYQPAEISIEDGEIWTLCVMHDGLGHLRGTPGYNPVEYPQWHPEWPRQA